MNSLDTVPDAADRLELIHLDATARRTDDFWY
jgi:hypothetical protein